MRCTEEQVLYEQSDCKRLPVKQDKGVEGSIPCPTTGHHSLYRKQERRKRVLGWRRTHKDPLCRRVGADPVLGDCQPRTEQRRHFPGAAAPLPGRYHPLQIRTREPRHAEHTSSPLGNARGAIASRSVICGPSPPPVSAAERPMLIGIDDLLILKRLGMRAAKTCRSWLHLFSSRSPGRPGVSFTLTPGMPCSFVSLLTHRLAHLWRAPQPRHHRLPVLRERREQW